MKEFVEVMSEVQNDTRVKSAVLSSGKADCFIAGADIGFVFNLKHRMHSFTFSSVLLHVLHIQH